MNRLQKIGLYIIFCLALTGCDKFLEEKPDQKLVVPTTLADFQALMDNHSVMNNSLPISGEISADNYYLTDAGWNGLRKEEHRNIYIWNKDRLFEVGGSEYFYAFRTIYYANSVLEGLEKIERNEYNRREYDNIKGEALYYRGTSFLHAAFIWALAYDESTASSDLGLPLRITSDFNQVSVRASLQDTYNHILDDLHKASVLLPVDVVHPIRPSKAAAYGMLVRTYLSMRDYEIAGNYADSCLNIKNALLDYNQLNVHANYPFDRFNEEVIVEHINSGLNPTLSMTLNTAKITESLYKSFHDEDLRKKAFFRDNGDGTFGFKGSYSNSGGLFGGITTAEIYLSRAECYVRNGKIEEAISDVGKVQKSRWLANGSIVSIPAQNKNEVLSFVLKERRKEMVLRGIRWMDIKRLNKEGAEIVLEREIGDKTYQLLPGDPRYALSFPEDVIELSGMPQNPR